MGLSVVSVLLVTRIIGPYQYGIFAAVYGIAAFIATAATWGLDVYLLRKAAEPTSAEYDQAFTLFTATSVFFVGGLTLFRHSISRFAGLPEIASPLAIMSLFIPCNRLNILCFLDSDDVFLPGKVERMVNAWCRNRWKIGGSVTKWTVLITAWRTSSMPIAMKCKEMLKIGVATSLQ